MRIINIQVSLHITNIQQPPNTQAHMQAHTQNITEQNFCKCIYCNN